VVISHNNYNNLHYSNNYNTFNNENYPLWLVGLCAVVSCDVLLKYKEMQQPEKYATHKLNKQ
jgi:hypothetical protein